MKILDRYIAGEAARMTGVGLFVFTLLLLTNALVKLVEDMAVRGIAFSTVLELMGLSLPYILVLTIPMSVLVGVLMAFGRLSSDSEITAMRACGISLVQILRPVLLMAALATVATAVLYLVVLPWSNDRLANLRYRALMQQKNLGVEPRTFTTSFANHVLYVDEVDPKTHEMEKIFLSAEAPGQSHRLIFARRGKAEIDSAARQLILRLDDGVTHEIPRSGGAYIADTYRRYDVVIDLGGLTGDEGVPKTDRQMTVGELRAKAARREREGLPSNPQWVEIHKRFALPVACLVFALLGVPLGLVSRRGGKSAGFVVSIGVILVYWLFLMVGENLGDDGWIPPALAMWAGNLFFGVLGLVLLRRATLERELALVVWVREQVRRLGAWAGRIVAPRGRRRRPAVVPADPVARPTRTLRGRGQRAEPFPRLLDRYVGRQYLRMLAYVIAAFMVISSVVHFFERTDDFLRYAATADQITRYMVMRMTEWLFFALPLGVLVGTMLCLTVMSRHGELVAMLASGVSLLRSVAVIIALGALLSVVAFLFSEFIIPHTNREADRIMRQEIKKIKTVGSFRANRQWMRGKGGEVIYYRSYDVDAGELLGVTVFDLYPSGLPKRRTHAKRLRYVEGAWQYIDVEVFEFDERGRIRPGGHATYERAAADLLETPEDFEKIRIRSDQLSFTQLARYIDALRERGYRTTRYVVDLHKKVALPLLCLIMSILGVPFAARWSRSSVLSGVGLSLAIGVAYMVAFHVGMSLGYAGRLPAVLAAWLPNALFALLGLVLMTRVRT